MDPHVDEQLVAGVERFVASHTASPETGKFFPFTLINVHLLDVPHQLLLAAVIGIAVDPVTQLILMLRSYWSIEPRERMRSSVLTIVTLQGLANLKELPLLVADLKRFTLTW